MRTTRAGFTDEDFYGSNDTDVVHFRYLHKLLRRHRRQVYPIR